MSPVLVPGIVGGLSAGGILTAAATDAPVPGYGYGAAGILVAALLVFAARVYWQGEKERVRLTVENARLAEARVVDAKASQAALTDAVATLKQSAEVSQSRGRELDRLIDQVALLSQQLTQAPRRPTTRSR